MPLRNFERGGGATGERAGLLRNLPRYMMEASDFCDSPLQEAKEKSEVRDESEDYPWRSGERKDSLSGRFGKRYLSSAVVAYGALGSNSGSKDWLLSEAEAQAARLCQDVLWRFLFAPRPFGGSVTY